MSLEVLNITRASSIISLEQNPNRYLSLCTDAEIIFHFYTDEKGSETSNFSDCQPPGRVLVWCKTYLLWNL